MRAPQKCFHVEELPDGEGFEKSAGTRSLRSAFFSSLLSCLSESLQVKTADSRPPPFSWAGGFLCIAESFHVRRLSNERSSSFYQVRHDVESIVGSVRGAFAASVASKMGTLLAEAVQSVRQTVASSADGLEAQIPAVTEIVTEGLADKCVEVRRLYYLNTRGLNINFSTFGR